MLSEKANPEQPILDQLERKLTFLLRGSYTQHPHMDWMYCEERLHNHECDQITKACKKFELVPPVVVGEEKLPGHRQADARLLMVNDETKWFFELICNVAQNASDEAYAMALTGISRAPQYVEYRNGNGEFGWHNDYSHGLEQAPRKLTVIIQLSDSNDYEGGSLEIMSNKVETAPRERGSIIIFPSILIHRVTPVVSGLRRAIVSWIAGPRHG